MSVVSLRPRPPTYVYTDVLGRVWATDKLDALLTDHEVRITVQAGVSQGLRRNRTWNTGRVWTWAEIRYRGRQDVAALLLLLVTRYFDTDGAHYLGRRPCR